jgi:hypothetical protein
MGKWTRVYSGFSVRGSANEPLSRTAANFNRWSIGRLRTTAEGKDFGFSFLAICRRASPGGTMDIAKALKREQRKIRSEACARAKDAKR